MDLLFYFWRFFCLLFVTVGDCQNAGMSLIQKTAVVTGGGSGIGLATALKLAADGQSVFVGDLRFRDSVRQQLEASGVCCQVCDVRQVSDVERLIRSAFEQNGRLDSLVNNAGVGLVAQIDQISEADWQTVMDTNLKSAFFGCRCAIGIMRRQPEGGSIVNVASNAGLLPRSHDPLYSISKMSLVALTKSLALCHSVDRIRINAVCPGPVERTQIIEENFPPDVDRQQVVRQLISASPLAKAWDRMVTPEEVADSILYLCSDAAQMISGTSIAIDGGKSLGVPPQSG